MAISRVVAIDHHPLLLMAIRDCLEGAAGIAVVGTADDRVAALRLVGRHRPDIVVLDLDLPDAAGIDLARQMRAVFPAMAVLATSEHPSPSCARSLMALGVQGYVANTLSPTGLVAAVQSLAAGETVFAAEAARGIAEAAELLTPREHEVLEHVAAGRGNATIARELGLSQKTVEYHVSHVLAKLDAENRVGAVARAQQLGLIAVLAPRFSPGDRQGVSPGTN